MAIVQADRVEGVPVKPVHPKPFDLLPLSHAQFHILLVLAKGKNHGYGIMKEIEADARYGIKMGPATLYRSIKRLLEADLIAEIDERPDVGIDDERRRYYRLTEFGWRVVSAEAQRLAEMVRIARARHLVDESDSVLTCRNSS